MLGTQAEAANYLWFKTTNDSDLTWAYSTSDSEPATGWSSNIGMSQFDATFKQKLADYQYSGGLNVRLVGDGIRTYTTVGIGNLAGGNYAILNNYPLLDIRGKGIYTTILKLKDAAPVSTFFNYVIEPTGYIQRFRLANLTLNCNWNGQSSLWSSPTYSSGFKTGGLAVKCVYEGTVEYVKVTDFGSSSKCTQAEACNQSPPCQEVNAAGVEAFGIKVVTGNFDQPLYEPLITVRNCEVTGFSRVKNGYCTGIVVETSDQEVTNIAAGCSGTLQVGQKRPVGCRTDGPNGTGNPVRMALVQANYVTYLFHGIAYGVASSENVDFIGNTATYCKSAFNCDTRPAHRIKLLNNYYYNTYTGINIGAWGTTAEFRDWTIQGNEIWLEGRYYNDYLCAAQRNLLANKCMYPESDIPWEPSYCVRLAGGTGGPGPNDAIKVTSNTFSGHCCIGTSFSGPDGYRWFYFVWRPGTSAPGDPPQEACVNDPNPVISGNAVTANLQSLPGAGNVNVLSGRITFP
ncbi:MAG: hypothetical protein HY735_03375 [Verrucomicrobia bacterium]|nr:hypothetical protein [Verrucomicrobiota bacterium]